MSKSNHDQAARLAHLEYEFLQVIADLETLAQSVYAVAGHLSRSKAMLTRMRILQMRDQLQRELIEMDQRITRAVQEVA